ncbi:undecaprenyldiphospho-muramoylpentapeptide beta-N-acetylglucosaminyltransferase [Rufibacter glacialis]|uniref:UDP-N-acetylglucosamine--N-acetylmuramyl-(pentapeptide) pyrophosphoryl-undecaprenol N-acetylglucosamine transferase n=1 Tax=Rufibacter glacialis TaxID=1259555 RepID=A0A5M8QBU7_9BACT|nr:undecaprenyldiphospho-muramoylpentapeptide beta-N-acetylglucosaminyltransferase [Rufibacter glacialis]KAA6432296.1 undecaprenyldiphospho-muramoylpentapeptide beta-N-acetylglucosaminyltransferase [Rufibacter glacialis]GGK77511.1 UDP-N-acetylglucosamine--N-acetylmuramyl-(pentapeptide) pyrophosphoryl-undecaprenol N-acetylglucosamine transferase [Rufibacter glacialis]
MPEKNYRFIISGGGTGGHIYPAVAIANEIKRLHPSAEILFVGAMGRMEMTRVPEAGYKIIGLWISGLQRRLTLDNLSFPLKVLSSVRKSYKIIKDFKPDAVVGVGGYASGPLLYAATKMGIPSLIQEQNSHAGITNKLLANKVDKVCVAYDSMYKYFPNAKIVLTGNPVRRDITELAGKRPEAMKFFGLNPDRLTFLVIGGSLGARTLNQSTELALQKIQEAGYNLIWQTGKLYYPTAEAAAKQQPTDQIKAYDFIKRMDLAYAAADVVISRAGALSISELCLAQKPAILVPSPNVAEDHQTKNAMALVQKEAAVLVKDVEASQKLWDTAFALAQDTTRQQVLRKNIAQLAKPQATEAIVQELLKLA